MNKLFRIIMFLAVLLGIIGLARNQVAWAANPSDSDTAEQAVLSGNEESVSPHKDDDCDKPENKDRPRCQDKKDKDKCKKNPKHCGSVKPPPPRIVISVTGEYSVGGLCTLSTVLNDPDVHLNAGVVAPLPRELPDNVQKVRQGCLLEYYDLDEHIDELPANAGATTICFAETPGKSVTVYFYDKFSANPKWVALETTADVGKACAPANESGVYVATFGKR